MDAKWLFMCFLFGGGGGWRECLPSDDLLSRAGKKELTYAIIVCDLLFAFFKFFSSFKCRSMPQDQPQILASCVSF